MASTTRRRILTAAIGGVAGIALGAAPHRGTRAQDVPQGGAGPQGRRQGEPQGGPPRGQLAIGDEPLSDALHVLSLPDRLNVVVSASADGVVLVDGGPAEARQALLGAIGNLTSGPVNTLFNTHWHPEQTGLNEHVGGAGGTIIAQENTRLWLTTDITYPWDGQRFEPLPAIAQPSETFYDEGGALDSGVRYGYLRHAAHTDGDLYAYFPAENVLAVGDAVTGSGWPLVDWWTGGWIGGIVGGLELILSLADDATRVVPARGPLLSRADLERQYEMYNTIYERLARLLNSGRGPEEAVAARPTREFDAQMGPPDEFVRRAFESLWGYLSPDA